MTEPLSRRKLLWQGRNLMALVPLGLIGGEIITNDANSALASSNATTQPYNYAAALRMSIDFYDAQKSGPGVTGGFSIGVEIVTCPTQQCH